jgi:hypothetical protein
MNLRRLFQAGAAALALAAAPAAADQKFRAELAGHALLPARSFVPAPDDAPAFLGTSGKFTAADRRRVDAPESVPGTSFLSDAAAPRATGVSLPFRGQPVQGFSGILSLGGGEFLVLTDNGFGSQSNSPDAMLMFHRVRADWRSGAVERLETVFLRDPDGKVPFAIRMEGTAARYLTGADFDVESVQGIGDRLFFGDEFGPYLVETDRTGRVLAVHEAVIGGRKLRSPDHYAVSTPAVPGPVAFEVRRSRGFEGMAASPDGRFLYPLFEGPLWDAGAGAWETKDGREYLRIAEFDVRAGRYTGRTWKYLLEANGNNIGDFNMIDADTALVVERDNGEGDPARACGGPARPDCFNVPAAFKRVYKIDLARADADGFVRKVGHIDLMDIEDPKGLARAGGTNGRLTFPFVTIEDVDVVDAEHVVVGNDNNLPYSSGRALGRQDDNELVLLRVPEFLSAR